MSGTTKAERREKALTMAIATQSIYPSQVVAQAQDYLKFLEGPADGESK